MPDESGVFRRTIDFSFVKAYRSRVQGVYSEINEIIGKTASEDILEEIR